MRSPLNTTTAPQVLRLFDYCFKQGVLDACDLGDDYEARDWLNERKEDGGYGLLSDKDTPYDWRRWRFTLFRWCRNAHIGSVGETYIDGIRTASNLLFCVVPIAMRFYLMGIEEWLEYPNSTNTLIFKQTPKIHWKPVAPHLKKITKDDFISYIQDFVYERKKFHEKVKADWPEEIATPLLNRDASYSAYDNFAKAMWTYTRTPKKYGKVRKRKQAAQDF